MPSYEFYLTEYLGEEIKSRDQFTRLITRASERLARIERAWSVNYRDTGAWPGFSRDCALCAIADRLLTGEGASDPSGGVKSVSTGSVSVTYEKPESYPPEEERLYEALRVYADIDRGLI
jgi:hypothetical protein